MPDSDLHTMLTATLGPIERNRIYDATRSGSLVSLRSGAFVDPAAWAAAFPDDRLRARAQAVTARATGEPPVLACFTAAAAWGLPVVGESGDAVHVIARGENPQKSNGDVVRHHWPLPAEDVVSRGGLLVTSLSRTVYDVIREATPEGAIALCDAAFRLVAWNDQEHSVDAAALDAFRHDLWRRIARGSGSRGIRQARDIVMIADARAQLPGESTSRYWMRLLGAPLPILQYPVRCGTSANWLDFAWPKLRRFGEFDGLRKYFDPALTGGMSFDEVLAAQERRQAAVERQTGWKALRWGNAELRSIESFADFLRRARILRDRRA